MHRSDYTAARRLQQQIPLPIADVLALLKQHGSPQATIAAYRAAQIVRICQTAVCSEAEAAHQYDAHQGNTERAIAAIFRTPVYLGQHTIDSEKWGYAITPLNGGGEQADGRHVFIQHRNFERLKPVLQRYPCRHDGSDEDECRINPTSSNYFTVEQCRAIAAEIRTLAQAEIQAEAAQMLHAAADYLAYACALPDCRYIDFTELFDLIRCRLPAQGRKNETASTLPNPAIHSSLHPDCCWANA